MRATALRATALRVTGVSVLAVMVLVAVLAGMPPFAPASAASHAATSTPTGMGMGMGTSTPAVRHASIDLASAGPGSLPTQSAPGLSITLDQVVPSVLRPGQAWAVRGQVGNGGLSSVNLDEVRLLTASRALDTPDSVDAWIEGDSSFATERPIGSDLLDQTLRPQQSADFLIYVPAGEVDPPFSFTSLPLRIDLTSSDGETLTQTRTVLPWFANGTAADPLRLSWVVPLTLPPDPNLNSGTGPQRTQAWLDVVGVDSPVRAWLDGLSAYEATFVVDPSLLVPLAPATDVSAAPPEEPIPLPEPTQTPVVPDPVAPTDPPTSDQGEIPDAATPGDTTSDDTTPGNTAPGGTGDRLAEESLSSESLNDETPNDETPSSEDDATASPETNPPVQRPADLTLVQEAEVALQEQLGRLKSDQLWWLPVADPDAAALIDLGVDPELRDRLISAPLPPSVLDADRLLNRGRHDVTWPRWTRVDDAQLTSLRELQTEEEVTAAVVPRSAFSDAAGLDRAPHGVRDLPGKSVNLLGYDETLSALAAEMPRANSDGAQIQRLLAHTLSRYQRSPANPGAVVVAPQRDTAIEFATVNDLAAALESAPWVEQVSADPLLAGGEPVTLTKSSTSPAPPASPLTTARITRIEEVRSTLAELSDIVPRGGAVEQWEPILNGLYSVRWRERADAWTMPLTQLESQVATIVDGVRINPTTVNFLAQEGLIQITIVNDLPITVQDVRLDLAPGNGRLRIIEEPPPITIGPQSRATVQFRARAVASGQVPVKATLSTPSGLQIGAEQEVEVRVRPTGMWIYWLLGGVAGVILVLGLTRAIRRPAAARPDMRSQHE